MATRRCGLCVWLACCLVGACGGVVPAGLYGDTHKAADLTPEAVWEAINAAKDGDTVELPAGTADWTGGWNDRHGIAMKAIIIKGAGMDKTVINDYRMDRKGGPMFDLKGVEGKPFRVTGITFDGAAPPDPGAGVMVRVTGTCKNYRIDHCKFLNADHMLGIRGDCYGLIDHCYFESQDSHGGNVQPVTFSGPGEENYRKPLTLGTDKATFFEDNEVHIGANAGSHHKRTGNNPWIAPNGCAHIVIRHNKLINSQLEIYSPGMNKLPGNQQCEIYDNEFTTEGEGRPQCSVFIGAGTAMVFNNTVTGPRNWRIIVLRNIRADHVPVPPDYPTPGQVGRATDLDGDGNFESTPCYAWGNTIDGKEMVMGINSRDANAAEQIQEGRDYFNTKPPEGTYKPYVYPHPLQEGWDELMKSAADAARAGR